MWFLLVAAFSISTCKGQFDINSTVELQFDINSTVEGAALAAKFRALESTWPINQCNLYDSDFFGPSVTFFRRVDYFSRSLQMRPCSMPADVHASLDGVVFDRKDDIVTLRHEFSAPLPTFHGVEVQFFYTIYDHMVAANFSKGAVVAKGDVLGQVVSLAMPPLRFELRVGGPYSLEYQAKHTTAYNVGFDPAVNWNWLLHIVDEPIPPPSLKLLTAVTGVVAGRVEFSIDGKAGWLNKVTYESLDRNYSLLAIAELDLNFRIGYFTTPDESGYPNINIFDESTMYLDPVPTWQFGEDATSAAVIYRTEIVLPASLHAGGTYFRVNVTDIWGNVTSLKWGVPSDMECEIWAAAAEASTEQPDYPTVAEYFSNFQATWPLDPKLANYEGLTVHFGPRRLCLSHNDTRQYDFNKGYNIRVPAGSGVAALASGVVNLIGGNEYDDRFVQIQHKFCEPLPYFHGERVGIYYTRYAHLGDILVNVGDEVSQGQLIAQSGYWNSPCCVGASLRIELRVGSNCPLPFTLQNPKKDCLNRAGRWDPHVNPWFLLPKPQGVQEEICKGPHGSVVCEASLRYITPPSASASKAVARYSVPASCPLLNRVQLSKQAPGPVEECDWYVPPTEGAVLPADYVGTRSTKPASGATKVGDIWISKQIVAHQRWKEFDLSYDITINSDLSYHYRYVISGQGVNQKRMKAFTVELGSPFPTERLWNANRPSAISAWRLGGSVDGTIITMVGAKFINFDKKGPHVIEFDSDRAPVWGSFRAKAGIVWDTLYEDSHCSDDSDDNDYGDGIFYSSGIFAYNAKMPTKPTSADVNFQGWIPTPGPPPREREIIPGTCRTQPAGVQTEVVETLDFNLRTGYLPESDATLDEPRRDHLHIEPADRLYSGDGTWYTDILIPSNYMANPKDSFILCAWNTWGQAKVCVQDPRSISNVVAQSQKLLEAANLETEQESAQSEQQGQSKIAAIVIAAIGFFIVLLLVFYYRRHVETLKSSNQKMQDPNGAPESESTMQDPSGSGAPRAEHFSTPSARRRDLTRPKVSPATGVIDSVEHIADEEIPKVSPATGVIDSVETIKIQQKQKTLNSDSVVSSDISS
eukprot:g67310.t1